jgi:nitroreductase
VQAQDLRINAEFALEAKTSACESAAFRTAPDKGRLARDLLLMPLSRALAAIMSTFTKLISGFVGNLKPDRAQGVSGEILQLPPPKRSGGMPLLQALDQRCSRREFSTRPLSEQDLSNLLWAAFGLNRSDGGRTAPSALNAQEIDVYAALAGGLYVYDAKSRALRLIDRCDARRVTGYQDFVDEAPLDLIYVADSAHLRTVPHDQRALFSGACAGAIAQNVYLYCASAGLATVVRAWLDRAALAKALRLGDDQQVLLSQTVGYPAG